MTTAVAEQTNKAMARPLKILVPLIKEDLRQGDDAAERAGMPYYQAAGAKLLEAREQVGRGGWTAWVKRNFDRSLRQAELYMSLAESVADGTKRGAPQFTSQREYERSLGRERPTSGAVRRDWQPDVDAIAERARREQERVTRLHEEELTRKQEREAQRDLALRIVDIGYKVLAKELHPDKGGSREMMARLNRARDHLKQMA